MLENRLPGERPDRHPAAGTCPPLNPPARGRYGILLSRSATRLSRRDVVERERIVMVEPPAPECRCRLQVRTRLPAGARRIRTLGPSRESVGPCGRGGNAEALKRDGLVKACRAPFPGCAETFHTTQQTTLSCCRRRPSRSRSVRSPQRRSALSPKAARSVRGSTAAKAGALRWRPITMAV